MKTAAVWIGNDMYKPGGQAFTLFLRPHQGAFGSLSVPTPGEFAIQEKKIAINARRLAGVGGGGARGAGGFK